LRIERQADDNPVQGVPGPCQDGWKGSGNGPRRHCDSLPHRQLHGPILGLPRSPSNGENEHAFS
jgi:hypothetical protein